METAQRSARSHRLAFLAALAVAELLLIAVVYQILVSLECRQTEIETACRALRSMTARGFAIIAVLSVFFWLRPAAYNALRRFTSQNAGAPYWMVVHLIGLCSVFSPLVIFGPDALAPNFGTVLLILLFGGILTGTGLMLWATPARNWRHWLRSDQYYLPLALLVGILIPDIADSMQPLWGLQLLTNVTFVLVTLTLSIFSDDIWADLSGHLVGMEGFTVQIGSPCSGVEGIALISMFMGFYAVLMRGALHQRRFWLVCFPAALLVSWVFNITRIALLILIGARASPEHALNGFHSYAGWLMFTLLALAILVIAHNVKWLHKTAHDVAARPKLQQDEIAASIAPFIAFMLTGVVTAVIWTTPESGYPIRMLAVGLVLWYFRSYLLRVLTTPSVGDVMVGCGVAIVWILLAPGTPPNTALGNAPQPDLFWIAFRLIGTALLVPVVEELFFRGYVLQRLAPDDRGSFTGRTIVALLVSSILFGIMHDRLAIAALSGMAFGILMLRTGRVGSAINAHITANAAIAAWALATQNWALI